jgi:hypothetical protein
MDIEENRIGYEIREPREGEMDPAPTPVMLYSIGLNADELLTSYAALRTYLKVLANRENEDLEQIQSAAKLLISLKSRAVRASKEVSLKAAGIDSGSNSA